MDWFRSWHGAPTDNKWLLIAKRAGVTPMMVSAVFWALLDYASQQEERGSVAGFDVETYASGRREGLTRVGRYARMSFSEQVLGTHVIANTQGRFSFPLQNCIPVRCKAHRSTFMLRQAETPTVSDLGSKPR